MAVSGADEHHWEASEVPGGLEIRNAVTKCLGYCRFCDPRSVSSEDEASVDERTLPRFLCLGALREGVNVSQ